METRLLRTVTSCKSLIAGWLFSAQLMMCFVPALPARAQTCEVYPIALPGEALVDAVAGDTVVDLLNGPAPGQFGWLSWGGSPSETALAMSLSPPGNSGTYVNPTSAQDRELSVGDWVASKPGVANSRKIRAALDALTQQDIIVPVWNATRGQGEKAEYLISGFARVRVLEYQLPGQNRITARFLGWVECDARNRSPLVNAGPDQTITLPETALLTGSVSDDGLPTNQLWIEWSLASGSGTVTFTNTQSLITVATFTSPGVYVLQLTASDGFVKNRSARRLSPAGVRMHLDLV